MEKFEASKELEVKYFQALMGGYVIEEMYAIVTDSRAKIYTLGGLRELISELESSELVPELVRFMKLEEKLGSLRTLRCGISGSQIGWIKPPKYIGEIYQKMKDDIGGNVLGSGGAC